jgi:ethanolamine permease
METKNAPNTSIIPATPVGKSNRYHPGKVDIFMLGVSSVLGGQYFGWNIGLIAGVYSFVVAFAVVSLAYIAFAWSMSEASGALPFAGGAYGLARCTLGFYPAFLVGCFQILQYIFSVAIAIVLLMPMLITMAPQLNGYTPLLMALCYLVTLLVQIRGGRVFWTICWLFGVFGMGAIVLFTLGNLADVDFQANAVPVPAVQYINGVRGFFEGMPFASWFFVGIEALNLASSDVVDPKRTIPRAQLTCLAAMLMTALCVAFVAMSLPAPGGIVAMIGTLAPLSNGFARVLRVSATGATWISLVPTYGVAFGFMWAYARLIKSMASSKLLPPVLTTTNRYGTPWLAHLVGSLIGYAACLAMAYVPIVIYFLFPITMAFAFLSYMGQCLAYVLLRLHFPVMKQSTTKSPLGLLGALYSLCVWLVCLVGVLLNGRVILVVGPFTVLASLYYYAIARKRQTFSDEENKILLSAHVSRFNAQKRKIKPRTTGSSTVASDRKSGPSVPRNSGGGNRHSARDSARHSARGSGGATGNHYSVIPEHQLVLPPDMALALAANAGHALAAKNQVGALSGASNPTAMHSTPPLRVTSDGVE